MEYLRPGVYMERFDASQPRVSAIRTDVAGFVGIAERGPLDTPIPLQSFRQFQAHFGDFTGQGFLAYSVRAFFENGGRRCWVVRVAAREGLPAEAASVELSDATGPLFRLAAESPGSWGNRLEVAVTPMRDGQARLALGDGDPAFGVVESVAGFERGSLVRLRQETPAGLIELWRVVTLVDATRRRLYFVHPDPRARLTTDLPVTGFDRSRPVGIESRSYRFLVFRDAKLVADLPSLSVVREHADYAPRRLAPMRYPTRIGADDRLPAPAPLLVVSELVPGGRLVLPALPALAATMAEPLQLPSARLRLRGGRDGLSTLAATDFFGEVPVLLEPGTVTRSSRGLSALDAVDEIALVAVPDIVVRPVAAPLFVPEPPPPVNPCLTCPAPAPLPPEPSLARDLELPPLFSDDDVYRVHAALIAQCEARKDRVAVLDPPFSAARDDAFGVSAIRAYRARFDSDYAALYYPWLRVVEPRKTDVVRDVPPSGHVLGQYAALDLETGVHRAPANRRLAWAQDVTVSVSHGQHEVLNPNGINVIRDELGRGLKVMGARTLTSDPAYRYVNVRRLLCMIRKAIDLSTQWVTFESNDAATRAKVDVALRGFLTALWQRGALTGETASEAFFVKCDESNNPAAARADGRLTAEVGVAPSKPFEFVLLRIGRQGNELEIAEAGTATRAA